MKLLLFLFLFSFTLLSADLYSDYVTENKDLAKAVDLYSSLHLDEAEKSLKEIIPKLENRKDLAVAYKTIAFINTLKQEQKKAEESYNKLFEIYPDYKIDFAAVSPKISEFFKDYHSIWLRLPSAKIRLYQSEVKKMKFKSGLKLPIEWHDPKMEAGEVIVYYKTDKSKSYSSSKKNDITTENYTAYFDISFLTKPEYSFTLTYYVEVYNYSGKKITSLGSLENPKTLEVLLPKGAKKKVDPKATGKWYTSVWFITTVSVAILATAGGVYLLNQDTETPDNAVLHFNFTGE